MTIKPKQASLAFLIITLYAVGSANAEIYKWTDKEGKVHFSATPPKDTTTKAEDIEKEIKFKIGKVQPPSTVTTAATSDKSKATKTKAGSTAKPGKDRYANDKSPSRLAYCNKLQRNINQLKAGKKNQLTAEKRASRLKADKAAMEKNCKGL